MSGSAHNNDGAHGRKEGTPCETNDEMGAWLVMTTDKPTVCNACSVTKGTEEIFCVMTRLSLVEVQRRFEGNYYVIFMAED
jgi:hypothetical protein